MPLALVLVGDNTGRRSRGRDRQGPLRSACQSVASTFRFLLVVTDVDAVERDRGAAWAARIDRATPGDLKTMRFESGSMAAKVEAAHRFVEAPGGVAALGGETVALVRGEAGTRVGPSLD
jgi:carbamate kinase